MNRLDWLFAACALVAAAAILPGEAFWLIADRVVNDSILSILWGGGQ